MEETLKEKVSVEARVPDDDQGTGFSLMTSFLSSVKGTTLL